MHAKKWALALTAGLALIGLTARAQDAENGHKTLSASQMNALKATPRAVAPREKARAVRAPMKSDAAVSHNSTRPVTGGGQRTEAAERAIAQKKIFDKLTVSNGAGRDLPEAPPAKPSGS